MQRLPQREDTPSLSTTGQEWPDGHSVLDRLDAEHGMYPCWRCEERSGTDVWHHWRADRDGLVVQPPCGVRPLRLTPETMRRLPLPPETWQFYLRLWCEGARAYLDTFSPSPEALEADAALAAIEAAIEAAR